MADDSEVERSFAEQLEHNEDEMVDAKFQNRFKVPIPFVRYNLDAAAVIEENGEKKFYFVVETKHYGAKPVSHGKRKILYGILKIVGAIHLG